MIISKDFTFEAAHFLPKYVGACSNLHGHSYHLTVFVKGPIKAETGMVMDFKNLKFTVEDVVLGKYDHSDLNQFFDNPTAEIMVEGIGKALDAILSTNNENIECVRVELRETATSNAIWEKYN